MSRFWSDHVDNLLPYVPGEQPAQLQRLLKLNTNEHPYGPSPRALQAMRDVVNDDLRLYPDYDSAQLCQAIATLHGLKPEQILVGNGSDEILAHTFNALFLRQGRPLLMPDISYSFYRTYSRLYQIPCKLLPLADDFSINIDDYIGPHEVEPAGIIFANPNAPTGIALSLEDIAAIAAANPGVAVVVDEAYVDFGAESAIALMRDYDNVAVIHTLSKSRALAGIRVGFIAGHAELIRGVQRVKDSFNSYPLDRIAQAGATASILDETHFRWACRQVIDERESLTAALQELGFEVLPSHANFLFVRHPRKDAAAIHLALRERSILVRHFTNPRISQFLRITVGTPDDSRRLCDSLEVILQE